MSLRLFQTTVFVCVLFASGIVLSGRVSAQELPDLRQTPGAEAGQIEQHFGVGEPPELIDPVPVIDDDYRRTLPDNVEELSLTLGDVVVEGSTVYTADDLAYLYQDRVGQEIALAEVFEIADRITARYRNDGYILSRAIVPPQTIADGVVRIDIVEGYIDAVRIEGDVPEGQPLLNAYADRITNSRPLSIRDLERYLLFFRDLPGINAEATISPAQDTPGASDLVILVEYEALDGFVRVDNRGTRYNGPGQVWLGAGFNSLTDTHQRTALTFATAGKDMKELTYLDLGYERHIDAEGRKLQVNLTETGSQPGHTLRVWNIISRNQTFKIGITNPLLRSRARNLSLYADFIVRNSHTTILNSTLSKDRVRFFSFGALYDSIDRLGGVNQLGIRLDQGVDILGASKKGSVDLSREGGRMEFTRLSLNASRLQRLNDNWSFLTNFTSQVASAKLLASEEFGVGGERCVRGYDPSEVTGDQGYCLLVEMRYGQNIDTTGYQLYGFYDTGEVRRKLAGTLGKTARLASAGLGVRLNYGEQLSGSFEITWPQMKRVDTRTINVDSNRIFFSLTARF